MLRNIKINSRHYFFYPLVFLILLTIISIVSIRLALPKISNPILVVNPNDDIVEQTPRGLDLIKNGILYEINDHGHGFLDLITKKFSDRLRLFLDSEQPY